MALAILIAILVVLIAGLVMFNILTSKKRKAEKAGDLDANAKIKINDKNQIKESKVKQAKVNTLEGGKKVIKDLFNKKDEKKKITCPSCGVEVEVYDGSGRCPYCGAKFVKK